MSGGLGRLLSFVTLVALAAPSAEAHRERTSRRLLPWELSAASPERPLRVQLHDAASYLSTGLPRDAAVRDSFRVAMIQSVVSLHVNPNVQSPVNAFRARVEGTLSYRDSLGASWLTEPIVLEIGHTPDGSATTREKDAIRVPATYYGELEIDSVSIQHADGRAFRPTATDSSFALLFELQLDRYWRPVRTEAPPFPSLELRRSASRSSLEYSWDPVRWAEYYEVEWTHVDSYDGRGGRLDRADVRYDFRRNHTRVPVNETRLEIPLVFERGYVVCRVRAVGLWGEGFSQPVAGAWAVPIPESGVPPVAPRVTYEVLEEDVPSGDRMGWQYVATYDDDGRPDERIVFRDGSERERQVITRVPATGELLVSETIYDHQGRATVQVLPSPVASGRGGAQPPLRYQPGFNVGPSGRPYDRSDFDVTDGSGCEPTVQPMGTASGTARYYSSDNPVRTEMNAYLPDAGGFPFVQSEYTPDLTGRVRRRSLPGPDHRIGSGHELRIYHGTPSQRELDRLFGSSAGLARHYTQQMSVDPNGQARLTVRDLRGNVVVTALAGSTPDVLDSLPSPRRTIFIDVLEEENRRETATASLVSRKRFIVTSPTDLTFAYRLQSETVEATGCSLRAAICQDCVYDLEVVLRDDCGRELLDLRSRVGDPDSLAACGAVSFERADTLRVAPGSYSVSKRLTVNETAVDRFLAAATDDTCATALRWAWREAAADSVDPADCDPPCRTCTYQTIESEYEVRGADGRVRTVALPARVREAAGGRCVPICGDSTLTFFETAYAAMLADVSPGGQYGGYLDTTRAEDHPLGPVHPEAFPLSVLNDVNVLPVENASWRMPPVAYRDAEGSEAHVSIVEGGAAVERSPAALDDVEDFVALWEPAWAEALVLFHPEYAYYAWSLANRDSERFDVALRRAETFEEALAAGYVDLLRATFPPGLTHDPFFRSNPGAATAMRAALEAAIPASAALPRTLDVVEAVAAIVHCNDVNYTTAELDECIDGTDIYADPERRDAAWRMYRSLYLSKKQLVVDEARDAAVVAAGGFSNRCIGSSDSACLGGPRGAAYADKVPRFPRVHAHADYFPDEHGVDFTDDAGVFVAYHRARLHQTCGLCPAATDFLNLLNALAHERRLTTRVVLPGAPPLVLTRELLDATARPNEHEYVWQPEEDGTRLRISLQTGGAEMASVELTMPRTIGWEAITRFACLAFTGSDRFEMRAYDAENAAIPIRGELSGLALSRCQPPAVCRETPIAADLAALIDHLIRSGALTSATAVHLSSDWVPGPALRAHHGGGGRWSWEQTGRTGDRLQGALEVAGALAIESCSFDLEALDPGLDFEDLAAVVDATPPGLAEGKACARNDLVLVVEDTRGARHRVRVTAECYETADCCVADDVAGADEDVRCCLPQVPGLPGGSDCVERLRDIAADAAEARWLRWVDDLRDSLRTVYVTRCLEAVESLRLSYDDRIYHETLFTFDVANNLVRTVPPGGVRPLDDAALARVVEHREGVPGASPVLPDHVMATTYAYDSINRLVASTSPDGGTTRVTHDEVGRRVLVQDARHRELGTVAYTRYDARGRPVERGQAAGLVGAGDDAPASLSGEELVTRLEGATRSEIVRFYHDEPLPGADTLLTADRRNHRGRLASIAYSEGPEPTYDHALHYGYDLSGQITELVHDHARLARDVPAVAAGGHHVKRLTYTYDRFATRIERSVFQRGQPDQLVQTFDFDAGGRLVTARSTSRAWEPVATRDVDARYAYYRHGPLARVELGVEPVQGLDVAYTIHGWPKGINSATLSPARDIGHDGEAGGARAAVPPDVFGQVLYYYPGDYEPIGTMSAAEHFAPETGGSPVGSGALYDGSVHARVVASETHRPDHVLAMRYRYDARYRLRSADAVRAPDLDARNSLAGGALAPDFGSRFRYDPNGNITHLERRGAGGVVTDELSFHYGTTHSNRLDFVDDSVPSSRVSGDLDDQEAGNYRYDAKGRLVSDRAGGLGNLTWTGADRIARITRPGGELSFGYGAMQRRLFEAGVRDTVFHVRDVAGRRVATYAVSGGEVHLRSQPLVGLDRLGQRVMRGGLRAEPDMDRLRQHRGERAYELAGIDGTVFDVVGDRRGIDEHERFRAEVLATHAYHPFGAPIGERSVAAPSPSYGFQGMARADSLAGPGNVYETEFRTYDARLGRWLSVDALAQESPSRSPYEFAAANPISKGDPTGLDVTGAQGLVLSPAQGQQGQDVVLSPEAHARAFFEYYVRFAVPESEQHLFERRGADIVFTEAGREALAAIRAGADRTQYAVTTQMLMAAINSNVVFEVAIAPTLSDLNPGEDWLRPENPSRVTWQGATMDLPANLRSAPMASGNRRLILATGLLPMTPTNESSFYAGTRAGYLDALRRQIRHADVITLNPLGWSNTEIAFRHSAMAFGLELFQGLLLADNQQVEPQAAFDRVYRKGISHHVVENLWRWHIRHTARTGRPLDSVIGLPRNVFP